jgi:hypothetical protein
MGVFDNAMYTVGHKVFKCLVMEKQDVYNAIEAAGLKVLEVYDDESFCVDHNNWINLKTDGCLR